MKKYFTEAALERLKPLGWIIAASALLLVALFVSAFAYETWQTYVHRFRLIIEVETPAGIKSGSSVLESAWGRKAGWIPQTGGASGSLRHGEAVFVDLGNGRNVISIFGFGPKGDSPPAFHELPMKAFGLPGGADAWRALAMRRDLAVLPPHLIPTLVTFSDLNDPATARVVKPDEFEQVFGPGVRFKRATIEITDDAVTRGIEGKVPLIRQLREDAKKSRISRVGDPFRVNSGQFERGL